MSDLTILLPVGAWLALARVLRRRAGTAGCVEALIKAYLGIFLFTALTTETLSLFDGITRFGILAAWTLFLAVCLVMAIGMPRPQTVETDALRRWTLMERVCAGCLAGLLAATFATAWLHCPNNWDSMTYHLPRVMHWARNRSVAYYPTAVSRQNYQMPLASFAVMHTYLLTGGDRFFNLIQWSAYLVSIGLAALVAAELGFDRTRQFAAALMVATIPMAILQASSTQNDLVVSVFLTAFALFMLRLRANMNIAGAGWAAVSLGLALLAKGTAYPYAAAIGTALGISLLWRCRGNIRRLRRTAAILAFIVALAGLLNAGVYRRGMEWYGVPLSSDDDSLFNETLSARTFVANIFRNVALHSALPSGRLNWYQYRGLQLLLGETLDDPKTTYPNTRFGVMFYRHENFAGNPLHFLLIAVFLSWFARDGVVRRNTGLVACAAGVLAAAFLFCLMFRWQPWGSRLHTPLFALGAPLSASILKPRRGRSGPTRNERPYYYGNISKLVFLRPDRIIPVLLVVCSLPYALDNRTRSLVRRPTAGREKAASYFNDRPEMLPDYREAVGILTAAGATDVGLFMRTDDWEYPFWALARRMREPHAAAVTFRHVGLRERRPRAPAAEALPEYVLSTWSTNSFEHAAV